MQMSKKPKPLIAVPSDCFFFDGYLWHGAPEQYLKAAFDVAHLTPIIIPSLGKDLDFDTILNAVDGVLITGAKSNVEPHHYGQQAIKAHEPFDPARDATSLKLIKMAVKRDIPLLAICRGIQELNVALGGSLSHSVHEIDGRLDHRAKQTDDRDEKFAIYQNITVKEKSCLAAIIGAGKKKVNSLHRQAIDNLSPKLQEEAFADDGTIEAVSVLGNRFALGLQWHPEYWAEKDETSKNIFQAFGKAAYEHQQKRLNDR